MLSNLIQKIAIGTLLLSAVCIPTSAEKRTVEADGEYVIGYAYEESFAVASERARADALRNASEQAGVFVEGISEVENLVLTRDQVRTISSNVLQVQGEPKIWMETIEDGKSARIRCHVVAIVDDDNIASTLQGDLGKLDEAVQKYKKLEDENAKLIAELEELKNKFNKSQNDVERREIIEQVKINDNQFLANQALEDGNRNYYQNKFDAAILDYERALSFDSNYADAYYNIGEANYMLQRYTASVTAYQNATRLNPRFDDAFYNLGICYSALKKYQSAIDSYQRAIEINPNYSKAYNNMGAAYENLEQYDRALQCFNRALEIDPNFEIARENRDELLRWMRS